MEERNTPDSLEELMAMWHLNDEIRAFAIGLIEQGANLGALTMAKYVTLEQIRNGNRTLRNDEMLALVQRSRIEVAAEAKKGIENARGA